MFRSSMIRPITVMSVVDATFAGSVVSERSEPRSWAHVGKQDADDIAGAQARWRSRIVDEG